MGGVARQVGEEESIGTLHALALAALVGEMQLSRSLSRCWRNSSVRVVRAAEVSTEFTRECESEREPWCYEGLRFCRPLL